MSELPGVAQGEPVACHSCQIPPPGVSTDLGADKLRARCCLRRSHIFGDGHAFIPAKVTSNRWPNPAAGNTIEQDCVRHLGSDAISRVLSAWPPIDFVPPSSVKLRLQPPAFQDAVLLGDADQGTSWQRLVAARILSTVCSSSRSPLARRALRSTQRGPSAPEQTLSPAWDAR